MKILKTLAVLFVLLVLTVGAVAEEYTPFGIGEVRFEFPVGLKATVNQTAVGHIDVVVDSAETDWTTVVAQMDHWGEIPVFVDTDYSFGATGALGNLFNTWEGDGVTDWTYSAMKPLYDDGFGLLVNDIKGGRSLSLGGVNTLMDYSVSTNTVVPRTYSKQSGQWLYFLEAYCDNDRNILGKKYCTISITYTNSKARKVGLNKVPVERIVESDYATVSEKTAGSIVYELANGHHEYGKTVITGVIPPSGANSFMSNAYGKPQGAAGERQDVEIWAGPADSFNSQPVTFFWYEGEPDPKTGAPTGKYLGAERIDVSVYVGGAEPWPNYISESEAKSLTNGELSFEIWNGLKNETADFAAVTYESGTAIVQRNTAEDMPDGDLTECVLRQSIKVPDTAWYYAYSDYSYAKNMFLGSSYVYGFSGIKEELADPENILRITGDEIVFEDDLFRGATYSDDDGLVTYYDLNSTEDDCGDIIFIQWYNEAGNPLGIPQWYVIQYKTMATTENTGIESAVPADAEEPTLFTTVDAGDYELRVTSYPQYSENGTQAHYELELFDQNGEYTDMNDLPNGEYNLFIPFPDDLKDTDNLTFTVNHYNADGTDLIESANEVGTAKVELKREDTGVWMKVTSLSPFVLSWKAAECKHENLIYGSANGTITQSCNDCDEHTAKWTCTADDSCVAGTEIVTKVTCTDNWIGEKPVIMYADANAMEIMDKVPTEPGKYDLVAQVGGSFYFLKSFTVTAAPAMPATGDNSLPLAALLAIAALALTGSFMLRRKANG